MSIGTVDSKLIADIDKKISYMMEHGYEDTTIRKSLRAIAPIVLSMTETLEAKHLELYTHAYRGFHAYLTLLH